MTTTNLTWKKYHPLTDNNAFICLVDSMGDDSSIVQAARVSYGKDERVHKETAKSLDKEEFSCLDGGEPLVQKTYGEVKRKIAEKDRNLIRYLMNHGHSTPFEMVELKFMVQVPMDCWRQWVRHRTASINEYSTRYTEALDFFQVTSPSEWRLQATDNKQGSSGYLEEWPHDPGDFIPYEGEPNVISPGTYLSNKEKTFHKAAKDLYEKRLIFGIAKEQARKDLPLSTYTRAYWKCDLHNIFNFLRLRMDSYAQLEIRQFANCMFEIVKQVCPVACEAFEDYVLHSKKFSRMEMDLLHKLVHYSKNYSLGGPPATPFALEKPDSLTNREWKEFLEKLS